MSETDEKNLNATNDMIETALGFGLEDNRWGGQIGVTRRVVLPYIVSCMQSASVA